MKKYTLFFVCCLASLFAVEAVSAQGYTGPGANSVPGVNPPPPPAGPGIYPPAPGVNPPPPPAGPGIYPPAPGVNPPPPPAGPGIYPPAPGVNPPPPPAPGQVPPPPPAWEVPGQYGFTGPARTITVAQAEALAHRTPVIVKGAIVQAIGGDLYLFSDSSGEILIRIGPREWYALGSTISPSDQIEISGELHRDQRYWQSAPEIHARYIRKI